MKVPCIFLFVIVVFLLYIFPLYKLVLNLNHKNAGLFIYFNFFFFFHFFSTNKFGCWCLLYFFLNCDWCIIMHVSMRVWQNKRKHPLSPPSSETKSENRTKIFYKFSSAFDRELNKKNKMNRSVLFAFVWLVNARFWLIMMEM